MICQTVATVELRSPPTLTPDTPVSEAAQHLRRPDVPAVVVRDGDAITGTVTESDIVALVADAETASRPAVSEIASQPVTIPPSTTLQDAAETMRTAGVAHLVVDDGSYRGLLSAETLAPYLSRTQLEIERREEPRHLESTGNATLTADD